MIDYDLFHKIKYLQKEEGLKVSQIASHINLDERTVKKWISKEKFENRKQSNRTSILDPYKLQIKSLIEKYNLTGVQVLARIKASGYSGGKTIVNDYVSLIKPPKKKVFLTLDFAPGECAQVDWGSFKTVRVGNTKRRLYFFVMVLCYSRMMYVEFTLSQSMEFFLGCHQNAFEYFGYIPEKIMIDNLKTGVLRHPYGGVPVFNPKYLDFSNHFGFKPVACNVGKGNEKGIVENGVKYVKQNFLNGLDISDFKILNPMAIAWMNETANVRIHGETRKKPIDLFEKEKSSLRPLGLKLYDVGIIQQVRVNHQFRVIFESNKYSVPFKLASSKLLMKRYPDKLVFLKDYKIVCEHIRSFERHKNFENKEHVIELLQQKRKAKDQKIYLRFLNLSDKSEFYYSMLEQKRLNPKVHIRKIVALSEIYGEEKIARAIKDAIEFDVYSSEYIENLVEQRERAKNLNEPGALHLTRREDLLALEIEEPNLDLYSKFETES
jgi:transposase